MAGVNDAMKLFDFIAEQPSSEQHGNTGSEKNVV